MSTYKRKSTWWYKFKFAGMTIRESSNSPILAVAQRCERERRRNLELGASGLKKIGAPALFSVAARKWLEEKKPHWSDSNIRIETYNLNHLLEHFGKMLLSDIDGPCVSRYQAKRKAADASGRTVNMEVGTLRAILRKHRMWAAIQPDVKPLRVRTDVGRALADDEIHRLLLSSQRSRSRSLYPALVISLSTTLRNAELRGLRWRSIDFLKEELIVGKSKTAGGEGRKVPLTKEAVAFLKMWRSNFPNAQPAHFVFPSERYGLAGEKGRKAGAAVAYDVDPTQRIGPWKFSWDTARKDAKVECRWHDLRHTAISRLAESQASDATIMSISGHLSRKMMERYSHVRNEAKRDAIHALENVARISVVGQFPDCQ